ncbi:Transposon Ty4-J Gag-Pol polyprotein [Symbiodinium microadriaticum]|uniref:Transposon Ty4-J Gag-Pol polyprotein n=1 Tax=Symbiodinium microadriaticum TaxID=2951 RepID=A0A1Q9DSH4_SYMMI|nr:Transposon Ty4-J Gag-Pol polyprotein [Symbiodinium microadriaticum]
MGSDGFRESSQFVFCPGSAKGSIDSSCPRRETAQWTSAREREDVNCPFPARCAKRCEEKLYRYQAKNALFVRLVSGVMGPFDGSWLWGSWGQELGDEGPLSAKPRRTSQLSKAERPPPLPLNEKQDDADSVISQPTSAHLPSPPGPPKGGASPGGLQLGQDAKANGHSVKPVKEVSMTEVERAPGPMSPRGAPPPRQMPPAAEPAQPKKMPINFREDVAHFAPPSRPTGSVKPDGKAASSGMGAQGIGVVAPVTPDMAARLLAYKERQERKGKKKQGLAGQANAANFLSQVPEVERDIPLRFMFEISGGMHERLVHSACDSEQALAMYNGVSEGAPKKEEPDPALIQKIYRSGSSGFLPHTCLCEVPWSVAETDSKKRASSKVRLAKLSFRALLPGKLTKACNSQSDAESSCTVFMIHVDEAPTMRERLVIMEEEAAAILEAVDGLEPEYEFQSVEGGGNGSPRQAQDSYHGVDDGSLNGPGDRVPRAVEERAVDGGRLNGVARELGVSRTSGGQSDGAERQLYRLAQSGVPSAADVGGPSLEGLNPERERRCKLQTCKLWKQQVNASTAAGVVDGQALGLEDGDAKAPGGGKASKVEYIPRKDFRAVAERWSEWAPGEEVDKPLDADPNPVPPDGGAVDDAEWLAGEALGVEEADPELSAKEISEAKATWNEWEKLVKCSREDWLAEAQSQVLPKVEMVDFVYVETVERKTHGEVLTAIGRIILEEADSEKTNWPLAAKLAAHELKNDGRFQPKDLATLAVVVSKLEQVEEPEFLKLLVPQVSWPMQVNVSGALDWVAGQHREVQSLLQAVDDGGNEFPADGDRPYWEALEALESQGRELQRIEDELLQSACPVVLRSLSVTDTMGSEDGELSAAAEGTGSDGDTSSDPPPLQTKIIGADQVRREPEKWIPSMTDEYQSLVSKTGAVEELSEGEYKVLAEDPDIILEIIPGKLVYVHKTSGRRKSRIVGCGNFCRGDSSERCELYASGAGAESLRLMIRKCALQPEWMLASVDVRTAFLQAPLLEKQRDGKRLVTIVRVPSILRETGVTTCRFWKVRKALYGLASAPKSWSNHRDKVLAGLRIPCKGGVLWLSKMVEDANLLHIVKFPEESERVDLVEGQKVGVIALYVDDILIGAECSICEAVIKALQDQWELSSPEWLTKPGDQMKFAGYELQKTSEGIRLHQESYVQDLLEQNEGLITGEERAPAIKMGSFDDVESDAEKHELTKRAQGLIGQLLWLAGRTRPDLAYGVSMAAQKIASSPREALARAEHLVKYLRYAPGVGLHYKEADGNCGKWDQLRHKQTGDTLDVYTDASFAADEQCRSFGSVHLYWGGALVSWASARQTLIAAHTAESELYSLAEGHLMGKAFRPTVAALMDVCEQNIACHLYCDNAAAVQLCMLEAAQVELEGHVKDTLMVGLGSTQSADGEVIEEIRQGRLIRTARWGQWDVVEAVVHLMESVPPTRRPIPAVFLVSSTRERTDQMDRAWKKILEDYEADKGELLKFGPMCLDDGDAIHQAFADLATARVHAQEKGFASKEIWQKFNLASRNNVTKDLDDFWMLQE